MVLDDAVEVAPTDETTEVPSADVGHSERRTWRARGQRCPAWVVLALGDALALLLPVAFARHGQVELVAMASLSLLLFHSGELYRPQLKLSALDDAPRLAVRSVVATLLIGGITSVIAYTSFVDEYFLWAGVGVALQIAFRCLSYGLIRRARTAGTVGHPTLVIGSCEAAERIVSRLAADPSYGLRPVGVLAGRPMSSLTGTVPHLGTASALRQSIVETGARVLIVALGDEPESELVRVLRSSEHAGCDVFVVPRLFEIYNYGRTDHIGAVPVVRLPRSGQRAAARAAKRVLDIALSAIALVLCSPVLAIAALAVRIEGGKGVIFRQVRVGRGGRHFELMKFRSLKPLDDTESATRWNVSDDDRMGRVGRLLRRTSIDELPQLINVIKGDMTLVGPRPERPHFAQQFSEEIPEYGDRHRVDVGLTGLAQVSGLWGNTSIVDRARYDNFYIDNWTLWLDIKIMCGTLREVVGARGR